MSSKDQIWFYDYLNFSNKKATNYPVKPITTLNQKGSIGELFTEKMVHKEIKRTYMVLTSF